MLSVLAGTNGPHFWNIVWGWDVMNKTVRHTVWPTASPPPHSPAFSISDGGTKQWWLFHMTSPQDISERARSAWLDGGARRAGCGMRRPMFESRLGRSVVIHLGLWFFIISVEKPTCPPHRLLQDQRTMLVVLCFMNVNAGGCCFT